MCSSLGARPHLDREAGVAEHADHPVVAGLRDRDEQRDALRGCRSAMCREQGGGEPASLPGAVDRKRVLAEPSVRRTRIRLIPVPVVECSTMNACAPFEYIAPRAKSVCPPLEDQ
jgi:hypothetical protein